MLLCICAVPMGVDAEGGMSHNLGNIQSGESLEAEIELDPAFPAATHFRGATAVNKLELISVELAHKPIRKMSIWKSSWDVG